MTSFAAVACIQFLVPLVEQLEGELRVSGLVAKIIGNAAVGIDAVEMWTEALGEKPRCYVEVFIVRGGQPFAVCKRLRERGRMFGESIRSRQAVPTRTARLCLSGQRHLGKIA